MTMTRAQRRILKAKAPGVAAGMARRCYDFQGECLVPVTAPLAIRALTRAFARLLCAGGQPVTLPLSPEEAAAFPRHRADALPDGKTWLAVAFDQDFRGSYALQSASGPDPAVAHEIARLAALDKLGSVTAFTGFPMGEPRGRA